MCGIFAYLNYLTAVDRQSIADILTQGLKRLEYRGYDSAGKLLNLSFTFTCRSLQVYLLTTTRTRRTSCGGCICFIRDISNHLWLDLAMESKVTLSSQIWARRQRRKKEDCAGGAVKKGQRKKKRRSRRTTKREQKARHCCHMGTNFEIGRAHV